MKKEAKEIKAQNTQIEKPESETEIDLSKVKIVRSLDDLYQIELDRVLERREEFSDDEIDELLNDFRNKVEENLKIVEESFRTLLKDRVFPVSTQNESKRFLNVLYSENTMMPVFAYWIEADISEADMNLRSREEFLSYLDSNEYKENQKKAFFRLRRKGLKPIEICQMIEPRFAKMDSIECKKFANSLSQDFGRKTKHYKKPKSNK